jgi:hypothetical protein
MGMRKIIIGFAALAVFALGLASGCSAATETPGTGDQGPIYTAAARTVMAGFTQAAGETAVAQLTQLASHPTDIPIPVLPPSPLPPATPSPVATLPPPSPTPLPCDSAQFVGDVSVPDLATFTPGAAFTKTWRLRNTGTCTWTALYSLVFVGGDAMSSASTIPLPGVVRPGETIDVSVYLIAPDSTGVYKGSWMLQNDSGLLFGIGPGAGDPFWVQIQVQLLPGSYDYLYDLAANYCVADWSSGTGLLPCPGTSGDPNGSVILLTYPNLESGQENEPAIWTRPNDGQYGWVSGQFPAYLVQNGDHFSAEMGCLYNSPGCDVIFQIDYRADGGSIRNMGMWREKYDGGTTKVDLDLSFLANRSVQLILSATNNGGNQNANAFWYMPHIQNGAYSTGLVLTWHQTGGTPSICQELDVYLTGDQSGEARAVNCKGSSRDLGSVPLTADELSKFLKWVDRFKSFDAQVFRASSGPGVLAYISFHGQGTADATDVDIRAIQDMAERLFVTINR